MKYSPNTFRTYSPQDVLKLRGSYNIEHTVAKIGSERLWQLFNELPFVRALGCSDGNLAIQMVEAGLQALYASGWNLAASGTQNMYPDLGLYPSDSMPKLVERLNNALLRRDMIESSEGGSKKNWLVPIIADMESGFGNVLTTMELTKSLITSGVSCVHLEDQSSSGGGRRCGHLFGKCLVPTRTFIKHLISARLAADVANVSNLVLIARTDSLGATHISHDVDEYDHPFIDFNTRTDDGSYTLKGDPIERCIARGKAYSKYCDLIWFETDKPDIGKAREFSQEIRSINPNQIFAYNCSPSFHWKNHLSDKQIASFQDDLGELNYKFNFITLSSFHSNNFAAYKLASDYKENGMSAYTKLQNEEFEWAAKGFTAIKHQHFSGVSYFDTVRQIIDGNANNSALAHSTEVQQF